jgi:hypothetical protein
VLIGAKGAHAKPPKRQDVVQNHRREVPVDPDGAFGAVSVAVVNASRFRAFA